MEVYQSDFNAERQAREKIAGEKADLLEDIRRLKNSQPNLSQIVNEVRLKIPSIMWFCQTILSGKINY